MKQRLLVSFALGSLICGALFLFARRDVARRPVVTSVPDASRSTREEQSLVNVTGGDVALRVDYRGDSCDFDGKHVAVTLAKRWSLSHCMCSPGESTSNDGEVASLACQFMRLSAHPKSLEDSDLTFFPEITLYEDGRAPSVSAVGDHESFVRQETEEGRIVAYLAFKDGSMRMRVDAWDVAPGLTAVLHTAYAPSGSESEREASEFARMFMTGLRVMH